MPDSSALGVYLDLANDVLRGQIHAGELSAPVARLPLLDENLLDQLAQASEKAAFLEPRRGWAIALVLDYAAHHCNGSLQARAAWYLGRAYNEWGQPQKAVEAISRARRNFEELGDAGWIAACDWQINHLSWTRANFAEAARQLEIALEGLERAGFGEFASQCRLALSYSQILIGDFADAQENLIKCEEIFSSREDPISLARCWLNEASCLRRQGNFDDSSIKLEQALAVFSKFNASLDVAKTHYQLGLWYMLSGRDFPQAVAYFEQASAVFSEQSMDLWSAVCENGLAQIDIQMGNLAQALRELQHARLAFVEHNTLGLVADNYNDSGQMELLQGNVSESLEHFRQAERTYRSLGFETAAANALTNHGNASALLGYFQDALGNLETAQKRFQKLENLYGIAYCALCLSRIWTDLNQYPTAHEYLDRAEDLYRHMKHRPMLGLVYNQRAQIFSLENQFASASTALESVLGIAREAGLAPQTALAQRRLGEMLARTGRLEQSLSLLMEAETQFRLMGMSIEQAASLASLGDYHAQIDATEDAQKAYSESLMLCQGTLPEIESRCYAGLAVLNEEKGDFSSAMEHYRAAVQAVTKLRKSFWQPSLAGSYLHNVTIMLDKSVQFAVQLKDADDALDFIESSKAQTLIRQLSSSMLTSISGEPAEIQNLRMEIQALQAQIRAIYDPNPWSRSSGDLKSLQQMLIAAVHIYDKRLAALERESALPISTSSPQFDLNRFRAEASARLGNSWLALDYYLTEKSIIINLITPDNLEVFEAAIPARVRQALEICVRNQRGAVNISASDLKALGQVLLPQVIQPYLSSSNTRVIISPHRELHSIPWAALQPGWADRHLVEICVPALVPSLQLLELLWQRAERMRIPERSLGLLLGISDFQGKRPSLPFTFHEIRAIASKAHPDSLSLLDSEATWERLLDLRGKAAEGLSSFAFFHVSSHITHDPRTGRLSSIALYDQDVVLDHIRELAPLPKLVTLSACNGAQSLIYEGDEHVGIAINCLLAGANTIIGSLWPVLDSASVEIVPCFYQNLFDGHSPADALAMAQRTACQSGQDLQTWASFLCIGV